MRIEIAEIEKSDNAVIRIAVDRFRTRLVVDIRIWFCPDGQDEYVPSRKGITFDADKLPEIVEAFDDALTALESM